MTAIKQAKTRYSDAFYFYANDEIIGRSIDVYGEYSQFEVDFLLSFLGKDTVVYDIGANIGYHTHAFASRAGRVISFEPHPRTFQMLTKNTEHLPNVTRFNLAVSNFTGRSKCLDYNIDVGGNYGAVSVDSEHGVLEIECVSLAQVNTSLPDLIKIDVEGSEFEVIQSCMEIIKKKHPVVYYEAHETVHLKEIYQLLSPFPYKFYWVPVRNFNPDNFNKQTQNIFGDSTLHSIVAWPDYLPELELWPVQDADDTLEKLYARLGKNSHR
jgi:FkbM family methyltransferase